MEWLAGLKAAFSGSSLLLASLTGLLGTAVLLLIRAKLPACFTGWRGAASKALNTGDDSPNTISHAKGEYQKQAAMMESDSSVSEEVSIFPDEDSRSPLCPPELSQSIDRLEVRIRARSAKSSG